MNPFKEIWFNTGKCIDFFLEEKNRKRFIYELIWIEIGYQELQFYLSSRALDLGYATLFFLIAIPGIVILTLRYFFPWILLKTGKLMNGQGSLDDFKLVISLSCIPISLNLIYLIMALIIPGAHEYTYLSIEFIVWICGWRILLIGVAKVQRISYTFALMNISIPFILITILYLIVRY